MCLPEDESDGPVDTKLLHPYFGMHESTWSDAPGQTEFHLPHGEWIALLRANNFVVERLLELGAPADATTEYAWANAEWAKQWPTEEAWVVRKGQAG
jgi:hypothetical protein